MAEFFGDLERLVADLYPYRWPIAVGVLVVLAAIATFGYKRGWHAFFWRHGRPTVLIGTPLLALLVFIGWDLGSPLFTNKTVEEEFPFAFAADVPTDMDREDVEKVMDMMAKVDLEVVEPMPETAKGTAEGEGDSKVTSAQPTTSPSVADTPVPTSIPTSAPAATPTPLGSPAGQQAATPPTSVPAPTLTPIPVPTATPMPQPTVVTSAQPGAVKLKFGNLRDQDAFHKGSGEATIYQGPDGSYLLRLENLDVTNGPDLHVILTPSRNPESHKDVTTTGYVDLGKLKGNRGNQNYPIPDGVDIAIQGSVVIYCVPFKVVFSVAPLEDVS